MEIISSIIELITLQPKELFYVVDGDKCKAYIFASLHPNLAACVIAIDNSNYTTAVCFTYTYFLQRDKTILKGKYNSEEIGEIMLSNLKAATESIKEVYFRD